MNATLAKSLVALIPICMLFFGATTITGRERSLSSLLQLIGAICLLVVVLAHICEALNIFPSMYWGQEHSAGHYLDATSAVLGLTLFPVGYLLHSLKRS